MADTTDRRFDDATLKRPAIRPPQHDEAIERAPTSVPAGERTEHRGDAGRASGTSLLDIAAIDTVPLVVAPHNRRGDGSASSLADGVTSPRPAASDHSPESAPARQRRPGLRLRSSLIALAIFVLINGVVQLNSYRLADPNDARLNFYRLRRCEALGQHIDALYLGTSHEFDAIDPVTVDATVQQQFGRPATSCNLAMIGSTLEANYFLLKRYIEDGNIPRFVVAGLWERNFNVNGESNQDFFNDPGPIWRDTNLSDLPDILWHFQHTEHTYYDLIDYLGQKTIPVYGYRFGLVRLACGKNQKEICTSPPEMIDWISGAYHSANAKGWSDYIPASPHMTAPYDPRKQPDYISLPSPNVLKDFTIGGPEIHYLNELLDLCQKYHIQPIMMISPYEATFFHWFPNPQTWPNLIAFYRDIARQHHAYFIDNTRSPAVSYLDFNDPQHLTDQGARKYSAWLGQHVMGPLFTGKTPTWPVQVPPGT